MSRRSTAAGALGAAAGILVMTVFPAGAAPVKGPQPGSPAYLQRDNANIAAAFGRETGPQGQIQDPDYLPTVTGAAASTEAHQVDGQLSRPTRPAITLGAVIPEGVGNPYRSGWAGHRGQLVPVEFPAGDKALLQGDLFAPLPHAHDPYTGRPLTGPYPAVVIVTGSIQASAGVYDWLAEDLAERGYVVLTFDVQGQGQSETFPHDGSLTGVPSEQQSNFDDSAEDAISFMESTPAHRYAGLVNPLWSQVDHRPDPDSATSRRTTRLALIGHSTGAVTVSYLQGVDPRIETAIALDKITATPAAISDDEAELGSLPGPVVPKVPTLGLQAEYGFEPQPYFLANCSSFEPCPGSPTQAPNPAREEQTGFDTWRSAGVDTMVVVPRSSTHLDFTDVPLVLPASAEGQALASYYAQAWLAKYLQHDPSADAALLSSTLHYLMVGPDDTRHLVTIDRDSHLSFYFCSGYAFHLADGTRVADGDVIGDGCR
jgi:hypothetical protein